VASIRHPQAPPNNARRCGCYPSNPAGQDVILISSALDIPHAQPAVLHNLGPGETAVFRPGLPGNATLLTRIGASAWPTLLQAATTTPSPFTR
jgi:hypothetical protein